MPIDPGEAKEFYGQDGKFLSIRELKPGQSMAVKLFDIFKNFKTKYPCKGKDYNYRLVLVDDQGSKRLLDLNGRDSIRQAVNALYPEGPEGPLVPCHATLGRRTERKTTQAELTIERGEPLETTLPI